jgi:hypothetical protein
MVDFGSEFVKMKYRSVSYNMIKASTVVGEQYN